MNTDAKIGFSIAFGCVGLMVLLASCNACRQDFKRIKSNTTGINRTVTLYDANGKPVRSWDINSTYQNAGTGINFLDKNEKFVAINGTFIIEEK